MKQGLRWALLSFAGLLVAGLAIWAASRLWGVSPEQRAALALMRSEWAPSGRNGFDALWTLDHDVPVARQQAVTDADARSIRAWPAFPARAVDFRSAAADSPDLTPAEVDRAKFCVPSRPGCLAAVAADQAGYAALVGRNAKLIARADALAGLDHIKSRFPPRPDAPFPAYALAYVPATRDALLFAEGKQQEALGNVCRSIASWRRYASNSDTLIASMVAVSYAANGYGGLFADMLAELPTDAPVPAQCRIALGEVHPRELSLCQAMKGEFAYSDSAMRAVANAPHGSAFAGDSWFTRHVLLDAEATSAMGASHMAQACASRVARLVAQDAPVDWLASERSWRERFACIGNAFGCILSDIAAPAYEDYVHRMQDLGMKLKLLGTLLWLHENPQPGALLAQRLSQRPAVLRSPERDIEAAEDGERLRIRLYERSKNEWSQPLRP